MKLPYSPHSLDRRQNGSIHSRPFNGGLLVNLFKINDKLFVEYRKNSRSELQVESDNGLKLKEFQKRQSLAQSGANVKELRLIPWTEFNPVRDKRERESDKYNSKEQKEMQRNQKNCTGNDQHTSQEKDKEEPRGETCRS